VLPSPAASSWLGRKQRRKRRRSDGAPLIPNQSRPKKNIAVLYTNLTRIILKRGTFLKIVMNLHMSSTPSIANMLLSMIYLPPLG